MSERDASSETTTTEAEFRAEVLQRLTAIEELLRDLKAGHEEAEGDIGRLGH